MLRINIYVPDDLNKRLNFIARLARKKKAEIIRVALQEGLKGVEPKKKTTYALLRFTKLAEEIPTKGRVPRDIVKNLDFYTWGGRKHG